ncbi:MAG: hypothetical protein HY842_14160 [Bacteroidetes bacterium]|nr:hypothetical protein [Bacteroidota bacterium]
MKNPVLPVLLVFSTTLLSGQSYLTSGGIRLGTDWGLTLQQRVLEHVTVEGILQSSFQREEFMVTGLAERHYPVVFKGLNLYFGGGLHKGWNNQPANFENPDGVEDPFGVTFIGGAELSLGRINISYDYKPAVNLSGGDRTFYMQTGLSVRYVLISNKDLKKREKERRREQRREKLRFWNRGEG